MKCLACSRTNLPGGLRCVYCGAHYPSKLDFDISQPASPGRSASAATANVGGASQSTDTRKRGLIGAIAILAIKAKSLLVLLKFGKIALTLGSMLVYIAVYSRIFGWTFATGLAVCIFIHEMGHVTVNWMKGLKATAPMFIPFVGALIFIKQFPNDPKIQSESGAGGPAAGLLASIGCYVIGLATGSPFWFALSGFSAFINLFNMLPFPPLDGSHVATVFSPRIYTAVLLALLIVTIKIGLNGPMAHYSIMLMFILVVGFLFRLGNAGDTRHLLAAPTVRLRMAFVFVGLCVALTLVGAASDSSLARTRSRIHADASDSRDLNAYAASTDVQPAQPPEPDHRMDTGTTEELSAIAFGLSLAIWGLCGYLIKRIAGKSPHLISVPIGIGVLFLCLHVVLINADVYSGRYYEIVGAMLAASGAAIIYCVYVSVHRITLAGAGPTLLMSHALAWAASAALIVAYAEDSLPVAAAVVAAAAIYAAANRWILSLLIAQAYSQLGRSSPAIRWYNIAYSANPPADARISICFQLVALELRLSHGMEALNTVDAIGQLMPHRRNSIRLLWIRSAALMMMDSYDQCLECIEKLLQITENDPDVYSRLLLAQIRLAELTGQRGWYDECISQVDRVLAQLSIVNRSLQARMHLLKARAMCAAGDIGGSKREFAAGLDLTKEAAIREQAAIVQSAILRAEGHGTEALSTLEIALRENEGDLEIQFAHALALKATGADSIAAQQFKQLSAAFPQEHWGRLAAAEAQSVGRMS